VWNVVPIDMRDRDLAPVYPGISDSPSLADWNPPFPIDLRRIRPVDEEFWKTYRATPKAYIHFALGHQLWQSRYGNMTSLRFKPEPGQPLENVLRDYTDRLREKLDPAAAGLAVVDVRTDSLEASRGATNFGEYFAYFSFFIVVSALLLASLFFKLNVEQRANQVGLLRAVGFNPAAIRRLFMSEGLLLSVAGAGLGVVGGLGYGYLMISALRTWWVDAVGTTEIALHVSPPSLGAGAIGGVLAAMLCIWATLRHLERVSERRLLAGQLTTEVVGLREQHSMLPIAVGLTGLGALLIIAAAAGIIPQAGAFFGAGSALLAACLVFVLSSLGKRARHDIEGNGVRPVSRLGLRNAGYRPARSVLSIAMIASATFILISVDAFRRDDAIMSNDPHSGTGGYSLIVESLAPLVYDPASRESRELLGLGGMESVSVEAFRVRPGDDASCLNLYAPKNPRILGVGNNVIVEGRFAFQSSLASNDSERENPWLLLHRKEEDGAIPVIADANSMTYVLHRDLGGEIVIPVDGREVHLRLVAALHDSIFQSELLMSEANFRNLFPELEGFQLLLVQTPPDRMAAVESALESALSDLGGVATPAAQRLAEFHRVENTYLSTFQMLGGLGLLLGTVGLGAVLMRNVFERRRELAMLRAVGYRNSHFFAMTIAENVFLLVAGLATGALCAMVAIAPVLLDRGGRLPGASLMMLLAAVFVAGLVVSLAATAVTVKSALLKELRSE
ncbi:MAG: ABC transporter permease, partial [Acidobacteria bacterium]|nr:ABC transporter permease [Acidobacteriota bacterium]